MTVKELIKIAVISGILAIIGAVLWPFKLGISIYRVVSARKTENDTKNI